jgi:RNA polymerase sigma factor (sigma-70 family)
MNSAQVGAVLGYVRRLAAIRKDDDLPDHQLLECFALDRDEAAFAAMLKRHGPMVLGVCRSVLGNLHDAEDAFQATFLVLARKAGSIHRREAVSSWLQRVAYHLAVDAQAAAARRRVLERRAATMPSADLMLDLSLRELRRVLHEEIRQLPDEYRAPLVLCCLEEKSLGEAARPLGWTKWTVKGRLQRARERLRARLRRRGLELSLGLFAAVLSTRSVSAQVPAALAQATLRAAVKVAARGGIVAGMVSAPVAALVQGASKSMFTRQAKIATALLLGLCIAVGASGVVRHHAAAADPPAAQQNQAEKPNALAEGAPPEGQPKPDPEATVEVRGRVLDPEGKPLPGAKLYLAKSTGLAWKGPAPSEIGTSGLDGRFQFAIPRSDLETGVSEKMQWQPQVLATAEGHGCDWAKVRAGEEVILRLVKDVPINGRILDPDGKPVAGARVTMIRMWTAKNDDLASYIESVRKSEHFDSPKDWSGRLPGLPPVLTTGADGRFKLAGIGRERVVQFTLEGPGIASGYLGAVMTRLTENVVVVTPTGAGPVTHIVYGANFDYVAGKARPVHGVVRDQATGKPVAGALVEGGAKGGSAGKAVTDKEGRFELLGLAKAPQYTLTVKPTDGLHFHHRVEFPDAPGLDPLNAEIALVQALTVRGKVTDKEGRPVASARVDYYPFLGNPFIGTLADEEPVHSEMTTGPDGSYTLTVLPGPGFIGVIGPRQDTFMPAYVTLKERKDFFKIPVAQQAEDTLTSVLRGVSFVIRQEDYHALVLLEPGEKEEGLVKDVVLEPPQTVKGQVVGPDGEPLTRVTAFGLVRYGEETLKGAEFTVRGLNPRANRPVVFYHKEKNLSCLVKEWSDAASGPLTVKLQPCGSLAGRIVDQEGQPVAGLRIDLWGKGTGLIGSATFDQQVITSDKDGRFRALGLVPGEQYWIELSRSPRSRCFTAVESGKENDVGDIKAYLGK